MVRRDVDGNLERDYVVKYVYTSGVKTCSVVFAKSAASIVDWATTADIPASVTVRRPGQIEILSERVYTPTKPESVRAKDGNDQARREYAAIKYMEIDHLQNLQRIQLGLPMIKSIGAIPLPHSAEQACSPACNTCYELRLAHIES